ncbi:hypothetical protein JT05_05005 [Desulfosporosinus sp. Tol-M]|nr:hypothetical protein JT05_05005 [Desulfosporosinus sp. Tol-M]
MDQQADSSQDSETSKNLIPNQELYIAMMRRVWLDNSLIIVCQDIFRFLEEITADPETKQKTLNSLCKVPGYRQTLRQEWDKKEFMLERLADLLAKTRRQIRLESLLIGEEAPVVPQDGQE